MSNDSLKVGWIFQLTGSFRVYAEAPFLALISKGPVRFVVKLLFWSRKVKIGRIQPNLVAYFVLDSWALFLVVLHFHCKAAFSSDFLAVAWISCILEMKVLEVGVRKGAVGFRSW